MRKVIITGLAVVVLVAAGLPALMYVGRGNADNTPYIETSTAAAAAKAEYNPKGKGKGKHCKPNKGQGDGGPCNNKGKKGGDGRGGKGDGGPRGQ